MVRKSREITVRVLPKEADQLLRQGYPDTALSNRIIKKVEAEFHGIAEGVNAKHKADAILKKMKARNIFTETEAAGKEVRKPYDEEIARLRKEMETAISKTEAVFDRAVNVELRKAGITEVACFRGWNREVHPVGPFNWEYGVGTIYRGNPYR